MAEQNAQNKAFAAIVARSWGDAAFHAELLANPTATLAANGFHVPDGKQVEVVEDSDTVMHVLLPARPSELSDEELDSVAGGFPCVSYGCDSAGEGAFKP
ncbi:NHLP leader peptide family RiPP precursor [Rathayibacter soli]|uniref:NHLP leader peptide family RiPP precursor n=1 Tax=Rathayibacter soli TaxID=3144168 RepID=UPI0027E42F2A|nr:NHLP leader peptide family RiPP precursor [Glaciibacter superstes]